jgi:hypothetical protein
MSTEAGTTGCTYDGPTAELMSKTNRAGRREGEGAGGVGANRPMRRHYCVTVDLGGGWVRQRGPT